MLSFGSALRVIDVKTVYHSYFFVAVVLMSVFSKKWHVRVHSSKCGVREIFFLLFYSKFCITGPYKYNLKFHFLHTAYSDHVFLME